MPRSRPGPLALAGGEEFLPGNESADEQLVALAGELPHDRPAFVIATAAARYTPDDTVSTARRWFEPLGVEVGELPLRTRTQARSSVTADWARTGRFFYIAGGDPGRVATTLADTPAWTSIVEAWVGGAVLAGASAGAMALAEWTLIRAGVPGDLKRLARPGLALVRGVAVIPHFDDFGHRWVASASAALPDPNFALLGVDTRTAAIWHAGTWRVAGRGGVTVITSGRTVRFEPGNEIAGLPDPDRPG